MARITIDEVLDLIPVGGQIVVYAPLMEIAEVVHRRNMAMAGEWYDIHSFSDRDNHLGVIIQRRELWNTATPELLMSNQAKWKIDNVWRM